MSFRWKMAPLVLVLAACEANDGSKPTESAAEPLTVPAGMPLTDEVVLDRDAKEADVYVVDEDALLQASLLAHAGQLPIERTADGKIRVLATPPGSILERAGLRVADEVVTIAGESTRDDAALTHAYATLRDQRSFVVVVERNGERVRLTYRLATSSRRGSGWDRGDGAPRLPRGGSPRRARTPKRAAPGASSGARWPDGAVRSTGTNRFEISRRALDAILADPATLARSARFVPHRREGKAHGLKVFGIRRGSLFHELGLNNGDLLLRVDGKPFEGLDEAIEAFRAWKTATHLAVDLERRGKPLTLHYDVVP